MLEANLLPSKTTSPSSLTAHNIPVRINPGPSLSAIGSRRFALVVGRKPQDSIARGERARACAVGTFHQLDAALQKTLCFDLHKTKKGAFGRLRRFHLISDKITGCRTLNRCFEALASVRLRGGTHIRGPIRRLIWRGSARKGGRISKQSLEFLLAFGFSQLYFAFSCTSFYTINGQRLRMGRSEIPASAGCSALICADP